MKTDDFDFELPQELIAQHPCKERTQSRLLVLDKETGDIKHRHFYEIISYLKPNDVLVLNDTKVIPARIFGTKESTGANIELLLLKDLGACYEALVKPARRIHVGDVITFPNGRLKAKCVAKFEDGLMHFEMIFNGVLIEILEEIGKIPLPPYIHETLEEKERYQTVYAKYLGSAAAPTAGLHFTKELLKEIQKKGITICTITLHVGLGTFRPVAVEDVTAHKMHSEFYHISKETAEFLNQAKQEGRRIVAVGTTTTRALESSYQNGFHEIEGETSIFIYPGYQFKAIDALITNFHLPKSTLMMLVSALAGKNHIMAAYQEAVKERYRFFSFGDAMFITTKI